MNLPSCPNVKDGVCERSELRLVGENDKAWFFHCITCKLCWTVSKPRGSAEARYRNQVDRVKRASDQEISEAKKTKYFVMPGGRA